MSLARGKNIGPASVMCGVILGVFVGIFSYRVAAYVGKPEVRTIKTATCTWNGSSFDCEVQP